MINQSPAMARIFDSETGEFIDRPMTDNEINAWEADNLIVETARQSAIEKQLAREAAYLKLGLTPEEIEALR